MGEPVEEEAGGPLLGDRQLAPAACHSNSRISSRYTAQCRAATAGCSIHHWNTHTHTTLAQAACCFLDEAFLPYYRYPDFYVFMYLTMQLTYNHPIQCVCGCCFFLFWTLQLNHHNIYSVLFKTTNATLLVRPILSFATLAFLRSWKITSYSRKISARTVKCPCVLFLSDHLKG